MLTRQGRAERGADRCGRLCWVFWDTWMGRLWRGAVDAAHVGTSRTPAMPGWSWTRDPKALYQFNITTCWSGSSFSEIIRVICLSTHCNIAEMLISPASTLHNQMHGNCYERTLSVTNLWTCMHCGVGGCCDRGMTGCLFFVGFLFSSGKYQHQTVVTPALQLCWDQLPSCIGGFRVNTKTRPHMDYLLLAILNFYYENMRRQNKSLSNVKLWLSLFCCFLPCPCLHWFLAQLVLSISLSPQFTHTLPHHSPGVSLHPARLKTLTNSASPKSLPTSNEQRGPGK